MSHLLEEIKQQDETAAGVLEKAELCTDSAIQVLTREDLQDLFPGFQNLQQRKTIFEIIHKQKPVEQHPNESFTGEIMSHLLEEIKQQDETAAGVLEKVLRTDSDFQVLTREDLQDLFPGPEKFKLRKTILEIIRKQKPVEQHQQELQTKLMYRMVVSGKTFDAHVKLMEKVKDQLPNQIQLVENDQDHKITFVFCPICSRVASDVEAAMTDVKDDKPVILVLMHHTHEARSTSSVKTWREDNNVLLFVHVFYHETIHGLLKCEQNDAAVSEIRNKLLTDFFPGIKDSSGNAQGVGAESGSTDLTWWQKLKPKSFAF